MNLDSNNLHGSLIYEGTVDWDKLSSSNSPDSKHSLFQKYIKSEHEKRLEEINKIATALFDEIADEYTPEELQRRLERYKSWEDRFSKIQIGIAATALVLSVITVIIAVTTLFFTLEIVAASAFTIACLSGTLGIIGAFGGLARPINDMGSILLETLEKNKKEAEDLADTLIRIHRLLREKAEILSTLDRSMKEDEMMKEIELLHKNIESYKNMLRQFEEHTPKLYNKIAKKLGKEGKTPYGVIPTAA